MILRVGVYVLSVYVRTWLAMVGLGIAHSEFAGVPAPGFTALVYLVLVYDAVTSLRISVEVVSPPLPVAAYREDDL